MYIYVHFITKSKTVMNGLNMWCLSLLILVISFWDLSVSKKICSESVLEKREEIASIVISGTVKQLMPDKIHKNMYKGEIEIKRIFKGNGEIHNRTYNVVKRGPNGRSMVMIEGFGDPHICESVVRKFDTRIFLLNKGENGDLKLNSSIVRLTLTNLERTYAAVEDLALVKNRRDHKDYILGHPSSFGIIILVRFLTYQTYLKSGV
ncbi:hypothetical protein KUTeg_002031 [Tegillarca granosa]|uniref:NtA domain-containing protein n=1 Tax=Tegillarca granosa TaxID=220873 RepID=A0ABQ9FT69_TEGGR|nr:hypothetical protein KUTeg_002031 [Tegillarca granosa]